MFCTSCGTKNIEESNYCKQCGHRLDRATPAPITEEAFDRALPEEEQVAALLERAYRARKGGDTTEAIRLCEEALHLRHESTSAHSLLGQLYEQTGDRERAIREYERVLRLNPGSIADRVKLDELRGESLALQSKKSPPHIVLVDRDQVSDRGNSRAWMGLAAGVILMMFAGILYLEMRPHDTARTGSLTPLDKDTGISRLAQVTPDPQPANSN
ncbi:MAG TPA: tetratricopeptide repeat protein, partial [Chthonomonadaceae bacterium]|nr:tetratricopeptide repeat protein [Chthonomonadaceae bacterium]